MMVRVRMLTVFQENDHEMLAVAGWGYRKRQVIISDN